MNIKLWQWTALVTLVFSAFMHSMRTLLNPNIDPNLCASPFVLWSQQNWTSLITQLFYIRNLNDLLVFFVTFLPFYLNDRQKALSGLPTYVASPSTPLSPGEVSAFSKYSEKDDRYRIFYFTTLYALFSSVRFGLGYVFFRGTGWANPRLFFQTSFHECTTGILPVMLSHFFVTSFLRRQIGHSFSTTSLSGHNRFFIKAQTWIICCVLAFLLSGAGPWLLLSCVVTFGLYTIASQIFRIYVRRRTKSSSLLRSTMAYFTSTLSAVAYVSILVAIFIAVSALCRLYELYYPANVVTTRELDTMRTWFSEHPALISVVIVSAPRKTMPPFLIETIDSFNHVYPRSIDDTLYGRFNIVVYTEFLDREHTLFKSAFDKYESEGDSKIQFYRRNTREHFNTTGPAYSSDTIRSQSLHFSNAIRTGIDVGSAYVMLVEDDFPLCPGGWDQFLKIFYKTYGPHPDLLRSTGPCGIFIGTGGSGLLIRRDIADRLTSLLKAIKYMHMATDIIIQSCMRGQLMECSMCSSDSNIKLVVSERMLMKHLGFNSSTYELHTYNPEQWQCGWRQPFNMDADTIAMSFP